MTRGWPFSENYALTAPHIAIQCTTPQVCTQRLRMLTVRRFRVLQRLVRSASTLPATPSAQTAGVVAEVPQSHNRATIWSDSQRIRPAPHSGPRFEQIEQSLQPNPASAIELIAQVPVIMTEARKAACDGGTCRANFP